jgi:hypothetical protein
MTVVGHVIEAIEEFKPTLDSDRRRWAGSGYCGSAEGAAVQDQGRELRK